MVSATSLLSRALVFFPFFVAGYYCSRERVRALHDARWTKAASALTVLVFALWVTGGYDLLADITYIAHGNTPYKGSALVGMTERLAFMAVAIIISVGIIAVTPKRRCFLSTLGERTLQSTSSTGSYASRSRRQASSSCHSSKVPQPALASCRW